MGLVSCAPNDRIASVAIAFYNCENFFDTIHNPAKEDQEFTPAGKYHYTQKIYEQKLHNIASVLQSMGDDGPAVIGLAEVENGVVLNDLIRQPEIVRHNYKYVWFDGPDQRGINVAMLYNPKYFSVISSRPLHVPLDKMTGNDTTVKTTTRDVLYVNGVLCGDTIHLLINHWPSRADGDEESRPRRAIAAQVNRKATDSLTQRNPRAKIIVMGDFNDSPEDSSVRVILGARGNGQETGASGMYDPFVSLYNSGTGTEVYDNHWNLFDQIIVSGAFLQSMGGKLTYDSAAIYRPDFLVDKYKGHEGHPFRSYLGTYWIKGYSDHFPVILYLKNGP